MRRGLRPTAASTNSRKQTKDATAAPARWPRCDETACAFAVGKRETKQGRKDRSMEGAMLLSTALAAALAVATWSSHALAASRGAAATSREAVVQRCMTEAKRHYGGMYYSWGDARESAYGHCMTDAGLRP
jgi:hypothetical protein